MKQKFVWVGLMILAGAAACTSNPDPDGDAGVDAGAADATDQGADMAESDATPDEGPPANCDEDDDGFLSVLCEGGNDCDDQDPYRFPRNPERCDGLLPDGRSAADHDEDCNPCTIAGVGVDGNHDTDLYLATNCSNSWPSEIAPIGCDPNLTTVDEGLMVVRGNDCDDNNGEVHPNQPQPCGTRIDYNCDGQSSDMDGDGVSPPDAVCEGDAPRTDCDDMNPTVHTNVTAEEDMMSCNGVDNDCDPFTSERGQLCEDEGGYCGPGGQCHRGPLAVSAVTGQDLTCIIEARGTLSCLGFGLGSAPDEPEFTDHFVDADLGRWFGCALSAEGRVYCWGSAQYGKLGDGGVAVGPTTPYIRAQGIEHATAVTVGLDHACAVLADGSAQCWGSNARGTVGDGTTAIQRLVPTEVLGLENAVEISAGTAHTCALKLDGTVSCWGDNALGQLGSGGLDSTTSPRPVMGLSDATAVATGAHHSCSVRSDGTVSCWGSNSSGQLGDGTRVDRNTPTRVPDLLAVETVVAGNTHTCALHTEGSVSCWGGNIQGQLGDGTNIDRLTPVNVEGLVATSLGRSSGDHTCALLMSGALRCWGRNATGQIDDSLIAHTTPTTPPDSAGPSAISAGGQATCVLKADKTVSCFGETGVFDDMGRSIIHWLPTTVPDLNDVVEFASGSTHKCARTAAGNVLCWGSALAGRLGTQGPQSSIDGCKKEYGGSPLFCTWSEHRYGRREAAPQQDNHVMCSTKKNRLPVPI